MLGFLEAPNIHSVNLYGDWRQLTQPMPLLLGAFYPNNLVLSFLGHSFSGLSSPSRFSGERPQIRHWLHHIIIDFPEYVPFETKESDDEDHLDSVSEDFVTEDLMAIPKALIKSIDSLLRYVPKTCSFKLHGGNQLVHIVPLVIRDNAILDSRFRRGILLIEAHAHDDSTIKRTINHLTMGRGRPLPSMYATWL